MKQHFFAVAILIAMLITSCDNNTESIAPATPDAEAQIVLTLAGVDDTTRAFFDTAAKAETWESTLSSLSIFAFDSGDNLLLRRDFTATELAAKSAIFSLPKSTAGTSCSFFAVANYDVGAVRTKAALLALVESAAAAYNGTFAEVSTMAKRTAGFVMSGSKTQAVGAVNSTTSVGITLRRTVAKVALQTTIDPTFTQKYGGALSINSVNISRAASQSLLVAGSTPSSGAMTYTHTQIPVPVSGKYNTLFYLYENGALTSGNRVLLEINATYDLDGSSATTNDRSEVTYSIELSGKSAGEIQRNGYYRISANITGLVGQECIVSVTVADWETPTTQTVDLGA